MRFVLAIVAFLAAAILIVLGIAQRTVLMAPESVGLEASIASEAPYTLLTSEALQAKPGGQTVTASGSATVFIANGRDQDMLGWLGESTYTRIDFDPATETLIAREVTGTPAPTSQATEPVTEPADVPTNPIGSDLWLQEFIGDTSLTADMSVPPGISVLIAADGTAPAPNEIQLAWPGDNATPWAGPLIVGGTVLLIIGLLLYLWGVSHMRKQRGPRRGASNRKGLRTLRKREKPAPPALETPSGTAGEIESGR